MNAVTGIVLCGGHSRRMGRPKAWLPFGEEFLLQRVVRIVGEAVGRVIVVAAKDQTLPRLPDHVVRVDDLVADRGPLAGFAAGLSHVQTDYTFLTTCDAPFLDRALIESLWVEMNAMPCDAVIPMTDDLHPLAALYRTTVQPVVDRRLQAGQLRMKDLIGELACVKWIPSEADAIALRNINTPDEYTGALVEYNRRYGTERTPR